MYASYSFAKRSIAERQAPQAYVRPKDASGLANGGALLSPIDRLAVNATQQTNGRAYCSIANKSRKVTDEVNGHEAQCGDQRTAVGKQRTKASFNST